MIKNNKKMIKTMEKPGNTRKNNKKNWKNHGNSRKK